MLTMYIRALILYVIVVILMRLMGKRQIGQLQPYELVFTMIIADLAATPMSDVGIPLLYGVMPIAASVLVYAVISLLTMKSEKARILLTGRPSILVRDGVINQAEMKKQGFTITELMEQVRESGMERLSDVGCAVLEISGQVNVFPTAKKRAVTPEDLKLKVKYENLPLHLIQDGRLQRESLRAARVSEEWLVSQLSNLNCTIKDAFFCALDTDGVLCLQKKGEQRMQHIQALRPEEVNW